MRLGVMIGAERGDMARKVSKLVSDIEWAELDGFEAVDVGVVVAGWALLAVLADVAAAGVEECGLVAGGVTVRPGVGRPGSSTERAGSARSVQRS